MKHAKENIKYHIVNVIELTLLVLLENKFILE